MSKFADDTEGSDIMDYKKLQGNTEGEGERKSAGNQMRLLKENKN